MQPEVIKNQGPSSISLSVSCCVLAMAEMKNMAKPLLGADDGAAASSHSFSLKVKGMVCQSCVRKVEGAIRDLEALPAQG